MSPFVAAALPPSVPAFNAESWPFHGLADIALHGVSGRVECLDLEFTFAVRACSIEAELPCEALGAWDLADTFMPISLTTDFHLTALPGVEDVSIVGSMVLCGVCAGSETLQIDAKNRLRE
jgi:hypothetical protein